MGGERGSSKYVPVASKGGGNQARLLEELSLELAMKGEDAGRGEMLPGLGLGLTVAPGPSFLTDPPPKEGGYLSVASSRGLVSLPGLLPPIPGGAGPVMPSELNEPASHPSLLPLRSTGPRRRQRGPSWGTGGQMIWPEYSGTEVRVRGSGGQR